MFKKVILNMVWLLDLAILEYIKMLIRKEHVKEDMEIQVKIFLIKYWLIIKGILSILF